MARDAASRPEDGNAFTRFFDRVDHALEPIFGDPPMTDATDPVDPQELRARPCPVCGQPIGEHYIDESSSNVLMECPTDDRLPERRQDAPLNELGMPADGRRLEKLQERS